MIKHGKGIEKRRRVEEVVVVAQDDTQVADSADFDVDADV